MFSKFQDFLLVVVLFYSIYRIGFGEGVTTVNLHPSLCCGGGHFHGPQTERCL